MKWGLSVLDFRSHAIDDRADHPCGGVYRAECGHLLMRLTTLHEQPCGKPCAACAGTQLEVARAALDRAAAALRLVPGLLALPSPRADE
ncbi:MAG: hypothetical protein ACRDUV_12630 [Pseudonocardiaceae bacterium]